MKANEERDYFDYAQERNLLNVKAGFVISAMAGILYLLNYIFHFINF